MPNRIRVADTIPFVNAACGLRSDQYGRFLFPSNITTYNLPTIRAAMVEGGFREKRLPVGKSERTEWFYERLARRMWA
jgi:hypothetical protein